MRPQDMQKAREAERLLASDQYQKGLKLMEDVKFSLQRTPLTHDELVIKSAVLSQLGNAYFHRLNNFRKSLSYHKEDFYLTQSNNLSVKSQLKALCNASLAAAFLSDAFNEATSLANTAIERVEEALEEDKALLYARSYYCLGHAYYQRFERLQEKGTEFDFPFVEDLQEAERCYRKTLLNEDDYSSGIRPGMAESFNLACGNLANVCNLLGDFPSAELFYGKRLQYARSIGHTMDQIKNLSNLGGVLMEVGRFDEALERHKEALALVRSNPQRDWAREVRFLMCIASCMVMKNDRRSSLQYNLEALRLAQQQDDVGSISKLYCLVAVDYERLGNIRQSLANLVKNYRLISNLSASEHEYEKAIARELIRKLVKRFPNECRTEPQPQFVQPASVAEFAADADKENSVAGSVVAASSAADLPQSPTQSIAPSDTTSVSNYSSFTSSLNLSESLENLIRSTAEMALHSSTPKSHLSRRSRLYESQSSMADEDTSDIGFNRNASHRPASQTSSVSSLAPAVKSRVGQCGSGQTFQVDGDFFESIMRIQGCRLEDQRTMGPKGVSFAPETPFLSTRSENPEDILDLIVCIQGRRMEEQRASLVLPDLTNKEANYLRNLGSQKPQDLSEDNLYDLIMDRQSQRLEDQRSELGGRPRSCSALPADLPDDVTDLIMAMQAGRYESQRAHLKPPNASDSELAVSNGQANMETRCVSASAAVNYGASPPPSS